MATLIDKLTTGGDVLPGSYSADFGDGAYALSDKYTAGTNKLHPGLFCGRNHLGTNHTQTVSLDEISPITAQDIIGVVAWPRFGAQSAGGTTDLSYDGIGFYATGDKLQVMHSTEGYIYVFAGETIDGTAALAVAATTTGTQGNPDYVKAGSLVTSAFVAGPTVDLTGLATLNAQNNTVSYAKGQLVPVSLQIINR